MPMNFCSLAVGISTDDEPALWLKDDTGDPSGIEVGLPDERLLRRAAGKADEVIKGPAAGRWYLVKAARNPPSLKP